jgi:flagellar motor switch protein FliG
MSRELTNVEKAAVILMSLGKSQAAEVIRYLDEAEVKKLSKAFIGVQEVEREIQQNVAVEFQEMLRAAETLVVDGREFARDVISSAFQGETGASLMQLVTGAKRESLSTLLGDIPQNMVDNFVQTEHPQTIAFLLTKMPPQQSAKLIAKMSDELQTEVLLRITQLENVKGDVVDEVRDVLRAQLRGIAAPGEEEAANGGPKAVADILNLVGREREQRIVAEIGEVFPEVAGQIRNLMFTFEDLSKLDDRAIQTVLKEVPRDQLVVALKTASDNLRTKLFRNISQRAAQMLQEDLETLGPMKLKDVEKAQQSIIESVRKLETEGKIQIAGGGDDVLV